MLEVKNLHCGYPGRDVLQDLNVSMAEGTVTVIVGPNGCGKTTLLKAITGLLPVSGEIRFRGNAIEKLPSRDRAKLLSFLPQNRSVPEITAGRLVLHGRFPYLSYPRSYRHSDRDIALQAMAQMHIAQLENCLLSQLSGGERQKVYIAMMLAQETPIMLMDEPTSFLDISYQFELLHMARQLSGQGKTVVMVLHDLNLALQYADQVLVMEQGRAVFQGSPEETVASGVLQKVFHIHIERISSDTGVHYCFLPDK